MLSVYIWQRVRTYVFKEVHDGVWRHLFDSQLLNFLVRLVQNGQEHVEQHEEDEEDVEDEVGRAEDAVGLFQLVEVEVAEDDSEQREAASEDDDKTRMLIHGYVQKCST